MSDAKPKPRPRPRPVKASGSQENKDDDAFFIRNQTRSTTTWAKLSKLNQAKPHKDDDDDEEEVPRTKPKVPRWQREHKSVLSSGLSDDEDSDTLVLDDDDSTPRSKRRKQIENKRRSRSRSITPPPEIPLHQLQNTAKQIRQNLGLERRATSPLSDEEEDSSEPEVLVSDPELLNIVKNIRAQSQAPQLPSESQSEDFVTLNVEWKAHPLNEFGKDQKFAYRLTRTDNFRELYEAVADDASVLCDNVIITYRGNRIFQSVTPSVLGMWDKADLVACDKVTYEYVREQSRTTVPMPEPPSHNDNEEDLASATEEHTSDHDMESDAGVSDSEGDTFKLVLRSSLTSRDITLTVRPTTKCGAIVQAFLKKAGLAGKYSSTPKKRKKDGPDPRLSIDGDRIDNETEIGEMDLENGDLVEVVGL